MQNPRQMIGGLGNLMFKEAYLLARVADGTISDQYVQSEEYFTNITEDIKKRFGQDVGRSPFVAIHVRRGDYVGNPFYVDLFAEGYYERAMAEFPHVHFFVFSDDILWCKVQPIFKDCIFSEGRDEVTDMNLMASCVGHIVANSSFSWWGAYLSPHGGLVVAPKAWHPDGIERTKLPAHWKTI